MEGGWSLIVPAAALLVVVAGLPVAAATAGVGTTFAVDLAGYSASDSFYRVPGPATLTMEATVETAVGESRAGSADVTLTIQRPQLTNTYVFHDVAWVGSVSEAPDGEPDAEVVGVSISGAQDGSQVLYLDVTATGEADDGALSATGSWDVETDGCGGDGPFDEHGDRSPRAPVAQERGDGAGTMTLADGAS